MIDKLEVSTVTERNLKNIRIEIVHAIYEAKTYSSDSDAIALLQHILSLIDEKY